MKIKNLFLLALLFSIISACSSNKNPAPTAPGSGPQKTEPTVLEGTVVMIYNFLIPSANAMGGSIMNLGERGDTLSLPQEAAEMGCGESRCAFLLNTQEKRSILSLTTEVEAKVIAVSPVIDGKFKFTFDSSDNALIDSGAIYKIVVRDWDTQNNLPTPLFMSKSREITLSFTELSASFGKEGEVNPLIAINPETTIYAKRKAESLKRNTTETMNDYLLGLKFWLRASSETVDELFLNQVLGYLLNPNSSEASSKKMLDLSSDLAAHIRLAQDDEALNKAFQNDPLTNKPAAEVVLRLKAYNRHLLAQTEQAQKTLNAQQLATLDSQIKNFQELAQIKADLENAYNQEFDSLTEEARKQKISEIEATADRMYVLAKEMLKIKEEFNLYLRYNYDVQGGNFTKRTLVSGEYTEAENAQINIELEDVGLNLLITGDSLNYLQQGMLSAQDFNSSRSNK